MSCAICIEDITVDAQEIGCGHTSHDACIRRWSLLSDACPLCRGTFTLVESKDYSGLVRDRRSIHAQIREAERSVIEFMQREGRTQLVSGDVVFQLRTHKRLPPITQSLLRTCFETYDGPTGEQGADAFMEHVRLVRIANARTVVELTKSHVVSV